MPVLSNVNTSTNTQTHSKSTPAGIAVGTEPSFDAAVQSDGPLLDEDVARARYSSRNPLVFMVRKAL